MNNNIKIDYKQKISEAIFGLAIGDAVGVPVEFVQPHLLKEHPVTDMLSGGSHEQPLGTWSDDTSMTLALIDALNKSGNQPDYKLIMDNFLRWVDDAEYTSGGVVFDIGKTCLKSIANCARGMDPLESGQKGEFDCGNGALMRILPMLFWCFRKYGKDFIENSDALLEIHNVTSLTHGHERCLIASGMYLSIGAEILNGKEKKAAVREGLDKAKKVYMNMPNLSDELPYFELITSEDFEYTPEHLIKSSGYVIDAFEAAIWAFLTTITYKDCILRAVNLGHDTDTVAAIAGGLAGMYYGLGGEEGIPLTWLSNMKKLDYLGGLCEDFSKRLEKM